MYAIDIYNKTGKVPCQKCGLDLVQREFYEIKCNKGVYCSGIVITKQMLETWAKEQGKELTSGSVS